MQQQPTLASCTLVVEALALLVSAACSDRPRDGDGGDRGGGDDVCPIRPLARDVLEETLSELFAAASFSTSATHGGEFVDIAFQQDLVGLDVGVAQSASLFFPCTAPTTFEPTCEASVNPEPPADPFFATHDRCFRLGCLDADEPFVDAYFTMKPATAAEDRHEFTTATTTPPGTATYALNPLVRWNIDLRDAGRVTVQSDVDIAHVLDADGDSVDASYTATVLGVAQEAEPESLVDVDVDVVATFNALADDGAVVVEAHGDRNGTLSGSVRHGADALASLSGAIDLSAPLPFAWTPACAD